MDVQTSCIEFVSSVHGEQRRRERNISKRDLQAAVKYGERESSHSGRWKITWENVVYIVDSTLTREVTSYAVPLPLLEAPVDSRMTAQASEAMARIRDGDRVCTSHTILIVDQSGSMRTADIPGHSSRSRSVFFSIANDFIAPQLMNCRTAMTDVVTLIEMRDSGTLAIHKEPISWVLHNKFVRLAENSKSCSSHGNFLPALDMARNVLKGSVSRNPRCAHALFLLSDGRQSDSNTSGFDREQCILDSVSAICSCVRKEIPFNFGLFGYSKDSSQFSLMREMSSTATVWGASAFFSTGFSFGALRTSISTLMTSLNASRTALTSIRPLPGPSGDGAASGGNEIAGLPRVKRTRKGKDAFALGGNYGGGAKEQLPTNQQKSEDSDNKPNTQDWDFYYFEGTQDVSSIGKKTYKLVRAAKQRKDRWIDAPMRSNQAKGIAIQKVHFAEGAERIVYRLFEVDASGKAIGEALVAKVSAFEEDDGESQLRFHSSFEKTQRVAERLAREFNKCIRKRGLHTCTPRVHFLPCFFYEVELEGSDRSTSLCGVLAEKRLDHTRYVKWNDNRGGVNNQNVEVGVDTAGDPHDEGDLALGARPAQDQQEERRVVRFQLDDEAEDGGDEEERPLEPIQHDKHILDEDVPQAFSHWTYVHTERQYLVCDIQGVMSQAFELTDPVIHSARGRRREYGKTDHGEAGMRKFLKTHQCNPLCKELGILQNRGGM